ncbi:MAG: hypothetical protein FWC89_12660 [Defluviitaleaceae bacterium]|nr:hypothetical protein [Defluviitaleaceae bacterium]
MIRITRDDSYADKLRAYEIWIDGVYRGSINRNETMEFAVERGRHAVCAKIDWCGSDTIFVEVGDSVVNMEVGSELTGWKMLLSLVYIIALNDEYLYLRVKN